MRIAVLAGGVGGARFVRGLREAVRWWHPDTQIDVIVNTGDDWWLGGLRITPDLDSLLYTLAGENDEQRGWGRIGESERVSAELQAYGVTPDWFTLGDLDLGTHIARTSWLRQGLTLSAAVERLQERWDLGGVRLHPATDQEIDTHVWVAADSGAEEDMHFQEWWTRYRAQVPALRFEQRNVAAAQPSNGALATLEAADIVLIAPSNPVVSIGTILGIPGMREAVRASRAPIVGVSPIIAGAAVRGMADACLSAIGVATDAAAVARLYGPRSGASSHPTGVSVSGSNVDRAAAPAPAQGLLDAWLVDESDAALVESLRADGITAVAVPLWMRDLDSAATLAEAAIQTALGATRANSPG